MNLNLAKLLCAGKSIVSGCGEISYRVNKHVYLPKFDSQKNPFMPPGGKGPADPPPEPAAAPVNKDIAVVAAKTRSCRRSPRPAPRDHLDRQAESCFDLARFGNAAGPAAARAGRAFAGRREGGAKRSQ